MLEKAFKAGRPDLPKLFFPLPATSFNGRLRVLSGDGTFRRSSLELSDAFSGASLICLLALALSVGALMTSCEVLSSCESSWKMSWSAYDFCAFLRGDVRSLFVVVLANVVDGISSPESFPIGLCLRSRAIVQLINMRSNAVE